MSVEVVMIGYMDLCDDCDWETGSYLFEEEAEEAAQEHIDEGCW